MNTNEDSTSNTREKTTATNGKDIGETVDHAVSALVNVGRLWAVHGLRIGRSALEASAVTLHSTSGLLDEISGHLDPDRDAKPSK